MKYNKYVVFANEKAAALELVAAHVQKCTTNVVAQMRMHETTTAYTCNISNTKYLFVSGYDRYPPSSRDYDRYAPPPRDYGNEYGEYLL